MKEQLEQKIKECGFDFTGEFLVSDLRVMPEVRDMCAADKCHAYNHSWSCPPACGTIESFAEIFTTYHNGIIFQTVGHMEDSFDYATIEATSNLHKERFNQLVEATQQFKDQVYLLSAGSCTVCEECSYPDDECRFPEKMFPSMEATGLMVNDVCKAANVPYNHSKNQGESTMTFCSCVLY
jgi:predicted metal-binding protein